MKLYYLGKPGDAFGWGICNANLARELGKLCTVEVCDKPTRVRYDAPVFVPISDHGLRPLKKCKAPLVIGYTFFELPLEDSAEFNAKHHYDWIFAGSDWCADRLRERGITHVSTLVQGVDFDRFTPQPWREDRPGFRVFSGGKLEYRKAQDIVIAAMRVFIEQFTDSCLVTAWHNPWPQTAFSMRRSNHVEWGKSGEKLLEGIKPEKIVQLGPMPNEKMLEVYSNCDVGLFPNRCEGGTNLVMMEFMAAGRPVIASYATGHRDVLNGPGPLRLTQGNYDYIRWFHCDVSDCLVQLVKLYKNRNELKRRGDQCRTLIEPFTWERAAKTIYDKAFGNRS